MRRQRCLIGALVHQSDPVKLIRGYPQLAAVAKKTIFTDIQRQDLPAWVTLVKRMQTGRITSLPFTKDVVISADPDYPRIRRLVAKALRAPTAKHAASTSSSAVQSLKSVC